jgi:hypothetical protein
MGLNIGSISNVIDLLSSVNGLGSSAPFSSLGLGNSSQAPLDSLFNQSTGLGANACGCNSSDSNGAENLKNMNDFAKALENNDGKGMMDALTKLSGSMRAGKGKNSPARQLNDLLKEMKDGKEKNSLSKLAKALGKGTKNPLKQMLKTLKALDDLKSDDPSKQLNGLSQLAKMSENNDSSSNGLASLGLGGMGKGLSNSLTTSAVDDLVKGDLNSASAKLDLAALLDQGMRRSAYA